MSEIKVKKVNKFLIYYVSFADLRRTFNRAFNEHSSRLDRETIEKQSRNHREAIEKPSRNDRETCDERYINRENSLFYNETILKTEISDRKYRVILLINRFEGLN